VCVAVIKTGSAGLIAYRLLSRDSEWVWLQTSARVVYKNSKPEFIVAIHRHLAYVSPALISTAAVPAMKPEASAIGITAIWPLENNLNV